MAHWGPCRAVPGRALRCRREGPGRTFAHPETCRRAQDEKNGIFHRDVKPENILIKGFVEAISLQVHEAVILPCLALSSPYGSFQPLFPGSNELDQISKIHAVTGIPANKALRKFKQSRIARFGFSFKKGKGIPPAVRSLPPKGFSLLYAMIKYDPDERISAHQALQHPYFQELWAAETQKIKITGKYIRASTSAFVAHFNGKSRQSALQSVHLLCSVTSTSTFIEDVPIMNKSSKSCSAHNWEVISFSFSNEPPLGLLLLNIFCVTNE